MMWKWRINKLMAGIARLSRIIILTLSLHIASCKDEMIEPPGTKPPETKEIVFAEPVGYGIQAPHPDRMRVADIDQDGSPDLLVENLSDPQYITILKNAGNRLFVEDRIRLTSSSDISVGDLEGIIIKPKF